MEACSVEDEEQETRRRRPAMEWEPILPARNSAISMVFDGVIVISPEVSKSNFMRRTI